MRRATRCSPNSSGVHGFRGDADAAAGARDRPAGLQADAIERFANPSVRDTIVRLCFGSSDRIPQWLVPGGPSRTSKSGRPVRLSAAIVASWARYAEGVDEQGEPIDVQDQLADSLVPIAKSQLDNPRRSSRTPRCSAISPSSRASSRPTVGVGFAASGWRTGDPSSCFARTVGESTPPASGASAPEAFTPRPRAAAAGCSRPARHRAGIRRRRRCRRCRAAAAWFAAACPNHFAAECFPAYPGLR